MLKQIYKPLFIIRTYLLFAFSLLFFRIEKMSDICYVYRHIFDGVNTSLKETNLGMPDFNWIAFGIAVVLMFVFEYFNSKRDLLKLVTRQKVWFRWAIYYVMIMLIFLFGAFGVEDFIYIQF